MKPLPRGEPFDLVVVGAGIIGVMAAAQAVARHPGWRILVLDRSFVGGGATRHSAGLGMPFGRTQHHRSLERESTQFYHGLKAELPDLAVWDLPFFGVVDRGALAEIRDRCTVATLTEMTGDARDCLESVVPGLRLAPSDCLLGGVSASLAFPGQVAARIASRLIAERQAAIWEGVEIAAVEPCDGSAVLHTVDGRTLVAQRVILAPGPWALSGPFGDLARNAGIRIKKVISLHLDVRPRPGDPVVMFLDDDAFLLPIVERQQWLFSFTCNVWDCLPEVSQLCITAEDRDNGLRVLHRRCPGLVEHCTSGRVFCDSYGPEWRPVVTASAEAPQVVLAAGCSGSGFRLAPAIARQAVNAVSAVMAPTL